MFHEKAKKNGARCRQSATAPLLYSNHSFSLAFLRMVSFAALTKSAIIRISYSSQSETRSCISCEKISLECITLSHKKLVNRNGKGICQRYNRRQTQFGVTRFNIAHVCCGKRRFFCQCFLCQIRFNTGNLYALANRSII